MAQIPVFHGEVTKDGRLVLDETERNQRRSYLDALAGKPVDVVVKVHREKRSLDQSRWEWGVALPIIGEALGYDKDEYDELHYALVAECFGTTFDQRIGREVPNVRSSQLNTAQYSEYMEWLVRWAAKTYGIIVPLPSESEAA